jgi:hypothetical protein
MTTSSDYSAHPTKDASAQSKKQGKKGEGKEELKKTNKSDCNVILSGLFVCFLMHFCLLF